VAVTPVALFIVCSSLLCLIGLDLWISVKRWKQGSRDLNPVVQHFVKNHGPTVGSLSLLSINLLVVAAAFQYIPLLWMLLGSKIALASIQIRSLMENEYSNPRQPARH
jgi:hypothetical protein